VRRGKLNRSRGRLRRDPGSAAEECIELALKYLEEGRVLVEKDPVQASERL